MSSQEADERQSITRTGGVAVVPVEVAMKKREKTDRLCGAYNCTQRGSSLLLKPGRAPARTRCGTKNKIRSSYPSVSK